MCGQPGVWGEPEDSPGTTCIAHLPILCRPAGGPAEEGWGGVPTKHTLGPQPQKNTELRGAEITGSKAGAED